MTGDDSEADANDESVPEAFTGLPDRPMSPDTVELLQKHDSVTACFPVYRETADPSNIVGVLVKTDAVASIALYNPDRGVWEKLFETELYNTAYSEDALTAREGLTEQADRVTEVYDDDEVEFIEPGESDLFTLAEDTVTGLIDSLPDSPVARETLVEFKQEPEVVEVVPHVYHRGSREILLFTVTVSDVIDDSETFGIAVYELEAETWNAPFTMDAERLHDDDDTEFEEAFDEAYETIVEAYPADELGVLTESADYDEWWIPGTPAPGDDRSAE